MQNGQSYFTRLVSWKINGVGQCGLLSDVMISLLDEAFIYWCDTMSKVPGDGKGILEIENPVGNISLGEPL